MTETTSPPKVSRVRRLIGPLSALFALIVLVGACSAVLTLAFSSDDDVPLAAGDDPSEPQSVLVQPNRQAEAFTAQVSITDEGYDPPVLYLPAGHHVRLVLRNHGTTEHHYVIKGLVPGELRWMLVPEIDFYDLESMPEDELADYGLAGVDLTDQSLLEDHLLHHLTPSFVPYKEASPAGIKPLGTEVHGWVHLGITDTITFFPLNTGRFEVQDVLHPEITGTVVVFLPDDAIVVG